MKKIYSSKDLDKFIELFNLLSEKNIKNIIKALEIIGNGVIKKEDIFYYEFIKFLEGKKEMDDLSSFFSSHEKNVNENLFNYLKIRISLTEKYMKKYLLNISLKYDAILQYIIKNNIIYLDDELRINYFYTVLLNIDYPHNNPKNIILDRFKANKFKEKYNETKNPDIFLNETIFGQLFHIFDNTNGKEFLLNQKERLFKVKLKGEKAIDEGGPYQEIISCICSELQSDYIELFIKTSNNKNNSGELRDKYIINPDSKKICYKKAYEFNLEKSLRK